MQAEKDAQVGYESLDSPLAAAFNPEAHKARDLSVSFTSLRLRKQSLIMPLCFYVKV